MTKKTLLTLIAAVFTSMFIAAVLYAGTAVQDSFTMETKEYTEHTYNLVPFSHKKHAEEYKSTCGDCHHDDKGKPLTNLKAGDDVQRCIECHKDPGKAPKGVKGKEARQYHAEALHDNCKDCHKKFNKSLPKDAKKSDKAPTSCNDCHPGGKKK